MCKQLFNTMKLHKQSPLILFISTVCLFLVGFGIICLILSTDPIAASYGTLGSIFALLGILIFTVVSFLSYAQDFNLALSLGRTRKEFLIIYALEELIWMTAAYILLILMALLERVLYARMFPLSWEEFSILPILLDWRVAVSVIPGIVILPMFLGAMYSRFGKGFGAIFYVIWMTGCLSMPRIAELLVSGHPAVAWLLRIPTLGWAAVGIAAAAAMIVTTIRLGMKQQVR